MRMHTHARICCANLSRPAADPVPHACVLASMHAYICSCMQLAYQYRRKTIADIYNIIHNYTVILIHSDYYIQCRSTIAQIQSPSCVMAK